VTGWAWGGLCLLGMFLSAALGDLISEEIRGWLDLAPHAVLRLAAARLDPGLREDIYHEDWLPELTYILRGAESRPITRLIRGLTFGLGLLISARAIAAQRSLSSTAEPPTGFRTVVLPTPGAVINEDFASLLAAAQAGREEAFAALWRDGNPALLRYLRVAAPGATEDVASEVWVQVIRGLTGFRGTEQDWRAWLFTIARRRSLDERRRRARHPVAPLADLPGGLEPRTEDAAAPSTSYRSQAGRG
jgi:Sigma-70 region 2